MLKFSPKMLSSTLLSLLFLLKKPEDIAAHRTCGYLGLTPGEKEETMKVTAKWKASGKRLIAENVVVPTYFHIVNPDENEINGNEQAQIDKLNEGFAGTGFSFELKDTMVYSNPDWWGFVSDDSDTYNDLQGGTREGDCGTLNVWWTQLTDDTLGQADAPVSCPSSSEAEGVLMSHTVGVGGSNGSYGDGVTLIHEVGHWMGLEHTFEGGCGTTGDFVDDTPEVAEANYGDECDAVVDSCPEDNQGPDLLDNFMDYLDDVCLTSFTAGQKERMVIQWNEYRGSGAEVPDDGDEDPDDGDEGDDCCADGSMVKMLKGAIGV